ncbi:methionine S-methyltransferase [Hordeum vulgare]|uniref:methionine S-methyltransferase n=1 Tax=Hordeum vulgare subsp. vulgare TaxID=112509 RepID=A0A8I6YKV4_HORVV|nr:methionine S-methyltransferase-like [Hordeum vulgare subsp. vulgare]KAE8797653.1 methionine S-methyltransferase [Hordeum vulgare]
MAGTEDVMDVESFLASCAASADAAYGAAEAVLQRLQDPASRSAARRLLGAVARRVASASGKEEHPSAFHFRIRDVVLDPHLKGSQQINMLTMMEMPSIFIPEDRSFTFYEGLNQHPDPDFKDKIVAELGCGNGWTSIALAEKWSPLKVYGLDINPRVIKIAWINLYLNALDDDGLPIYDEEGKTLLDKVEFHESDLLAYCRDNKIELDHIVGCIPQFLNPNPEAMSNIITENSSEEFLHSLRNYYALQDFVEDQFGLGLIARAVEEGIAIIKPMGIMIFSMGGRPGQGVCERVFLRRGLHINKLWQTKIMQAADVDISALVEIEKIYPHHFEFFMDLHGDQPVSARTALAYMKSGGRVSHAFSMYSCQLRQPNQVKKLFESIKNGFHEVSSSLDLSFDDDSVADEKIPFLVYLARFLTDNKPNPCEPPAGCLNFRNLVAEFMKRYHHIPLTPEDVVVFPSRDVAIENYLRLFSPSLAIVDGHLTRHLPKQWLTSSPIEGRADCNRSEDTVTVIEAPCQSDLLIELVRKLKPRVVVTGIAHFEVVTSAAFVNLLSATQDVGSRLLLDISEHLELSSLPSSNGVLKFLAGNTLPSHAVILCGLVKNQVYSDLEVAFAISEDAAVCKALSQTIEILEGHTSVISQHYYGCLLHELLAFQIGDQHAQQDRQPAEVTPQKIIGFSNSALSTLEEADFFVPDSKDCSVIHMDLDRSFLSVPSAVNASIFESFVRQNITDSEADVRSSIEKLVGNNYGLPGEYCPDIAEIAYPKEIVYGSNCLTLFNKLVLCCVQEQGTFFFPMGTNGHYVAAAKFMNAKTLTISTNVESGFKIEPMALDAALEDAIENNNVFRPWVYISGPTINPSGFLYSDGEIKDLVSVCAHHSARVVIDTSFSGLEYQTDGWSRWNLSTLSYDICLCSTLTYFMLGELSLQLTASGLDFGFLICSKPPYVELSFGSLSQPHRTLKYAFRKLLGLKNEWDSNLLRPVYSFMMEQQDKAQEWFQQVQKADEGKFSNIIMEQREKLKNRANKLTKTLESCGWDVVGGHGGISMLAKPTAYIGRSFKIDGFEGELDGCNIREAILRSTGLCISSSKWTGIPDYCRFSFALESSEFDRAMDSILRFRGLVLGEDQGSL